MVEKTGEAPTQTRSGAGKRFDWVAIHRDWRAGRTAEELAEAYGLSASTVKLRCVWIDQNFPPADPVRRLSELDQRLIQAQQALDSGALAQAERIAKTVTALIRAGRALQDWSTVMTEKDTIDRATGAKPDREVVEREHKDAKAELERRIHRLADHLRREHRLPDPDDPASGAPPAS